MSSDAEMSSGRHLRLIWPQWQGAGAGAVQELVPELPFDMARRAYAVGTRVLEAVLPPHDGPTATVPVVMTDDGNETLDGIESKAAVLRQLRSALAILEESDAARVTTLGGDCSVSVAPFSALADRYGDDLAVIWIDSHPDIGTGASMYPGYNAMAVSMLTGNGDPELVAELPATVSASRVALAGLHEWTDDDIHNVSDWGITTFSPEELRESAAPLLDWFARTGCARAAIHFDVDTVDADEVQFGLGYDRGGLTLAQVKRLVGEIETAVDVVGVTIAEYVPRQVIHLQSLVAGFPLIGDSKQVDDSSDPGAV
ncbi:MAG: arginase family protein [Leucobacter sp.]